MESVDGFWFSSKKNFFFFFSVLVRFVSSLLSTDLCKGTERICAAIINHAHRVFCRHSKHTGAGAWTLKCATVVSDGCCHVDRRSNYALSLGSRYIGGGHPSLSIKPLRCGSVPLCLANETFPLDCSPEITRGALVPVKVRCQRSCANNGTHLPATPVVRSPPSPISHVWKEFQVGGNKNDVP